MTSRKARSAAVSTSRKASGKPRVIVIAKRSSMARLEDGEVDQRARLLLKNGDATVKKWLPAHDDHVRTLENVESTLSRLGVEVVILHGSYALFDTRGADLVISVGGDGTLLAASHCVSDIPILGVNSAPRYSVGFFCGAKGRALPRMLAQALAGELEAVQLSRMAVRVNGQVRSARVLNEALFSHAEPAATSNYIMQLGARREEQKSSGFWIGTAAGSTGALRSAGGRVMPLSSPQLQFVVREPFAAGGQRYRLVHGMIAEGKQLRAYSKMHLAKIFLDGPYRVLPVRLGDEVAFETSTEPLTVLGLSKTR